ncbi:MAG TPA: cytochrome c oxidase subunit II [Rhizomicrobium sp.]|nr:cytochrome c oxidase subunit II [Rhizomicrobium sp.]
MTGERAQLGWAAATPLDYLTSHGAKADAIRPLTIGTVAISLAVIGIVALLLIVGLRRARTAPAPGSRLEVMRDEGGLSWLWIGVGLSSLVLLFSIVWTVAVLAEIASPSEKPALTVEITARQWWWQVRYLNDDPSRIFATANEIHIPVGRPVRFKLVGGDVIHSFWVPGLGGKTDLIPGQTNETWLEAREPGTYRGQCTEYCGLEHARMGLLVIAEPPAQFEAWRAHQLRSAAPASGEGAFAMRCGACHAVRGTTAAGMLGPDLSHFAQRRTLAAATLPNDGSHLESWLDDPQAIKPGNLMQKPELTGQERATIVAYLESLT